MIVHADSLGCVRETIVIAAALSIVDPRERPLDAQQAADEQHARFTDPESDFLGYLKLWEHLREKQEELSSNKFRRMCRKEFLNYLRVREWQDLVAQLRQVARSIGIRVNDADAPTALVHQALLSGLLSHIGLRDVERRDYLGARGSHFAIFPGSALFKKPPRWVMAAELVETTRLWGRVCARVEPEWVEPLAAHLVKRSYREPHWDSRRGAVMAVEKVLLYGIPIVAARRVGYARVDPVLSRELFIRHALVEGDWQTRHRFLAANRATAEEIAGLEDRVRRRDLVVDDEAMFELYDKRIPRDVVSARHFDSWWKKARKRDADLLTFSREELLTPAAKTLDLRGLPDVWRQDDLNFALTYAFEPGADADGVTAHIPVAVLNQVVDADFSWQVPGWREELVVALIRSLPKALRRHFVPAPDVARQLDLRETAGGSLETALAQELWRRSGVEVSADDFDVERLPSHLRMRFAIESDDGKLLAAGRDLNALRERLTGSMRRAISAASSDIEKDGLRAWEFGALPDCVEQARAGLRVRGYPALVDQGDAVGVRVFETPAEADSAMRQGLRRLLLLNVSSPAKALQRQLPNQTKLALRRNAPGGVSELLDDCLACAIDAIAAEFGERPRDESTFRRLLERVRAELPDTLTKVVMTAVDVLTAAHQVEVALKEAATTSREPRLLPALVDMRDQLAGLVYRGFATRAGAARLSDLPRYLAAINRRLERLAGDVNRDQARMWEVGQAQELLDEARRRGDVDSATLADARWLIEELRVSLFAQALGTAQPVSVRRIARLLAP
jgi:ATP-dependent helicase HrpA